MGRRGGYYFVELNSFQEPGWKGAYLLVDAETWEVYEVEIRVDRLVILLALRLNLLVMIRC